MRLLLLSTLCCTLAAAVPEGADIVAKEDWTPTTSRSVQLARDPRFVFATIFNNPDQVKFLLGKLTATGLPKLTDAQSYSETLKRNKVLSRIVVTMALGGVKYCLKENDKANLLDWNMPLATAICHGQRVVFEFDDLDNAGKVYSLWVSGKVADLDDPYPRKVASHGLNFGKDGKTMTEVKVKFYNGITHIKNTFGSHHHAINLAFGGFGSRRADDAYVGPGGYAVNYGDYKINEKSQHGHMYIFTDQSDKNVSGLLVGIEPTEIGGVSMYATKHTVTSSYEDSTKEVGVSGGQKFQEFLGETGPAKYGGMWVIFKTAKEYAELVKVIDKVDNMSAPARKDLFWSLLTQTGPEARKTLLAVPESKSN